jgi:hypothetical protein
MQYIISFAKFPLSNLKLKTKNKCNSRSMEIKKIYLLSHINEVLIYPTAEKLRRKKTIKTKIYRVGSVNLHTFFESIFKPFPTKKSVAYP